MKQRIMSLVVTDGKGSVIFQKNPCSPQDVMAAFALFESDDAVFEIRMSAVDISPNQQN